MQVQYMGCSWNTEDLEQCKQALCILSNMLSHDEVKELESEGYFGNLWVDDVIREEGLY